ncbi:hypothetical protein PoB_002469400 [Plakobranchus ocellatus]|uniref:Uncharacterized protein n=1 Tax=Plakobranchus ocellatus TaxID=259542 RepID=A0AAV3ZS76_9GAST|nr:hypothetical protein PoB_002469400 [Plakobranchus ocellatus]
MSGYANLRPSEIKRCCRVTVSVGLCRMASARICKTLRQQQNKFYQVRDTPNLDINVLSTGGHREEFEVDRQHKRGVCHHEIGWIDNLTQLVTGRSLRLKKKEKINQVSATMRLE